ncbi:MFS transporter [Arhodomonas aquaeolei]|uniref:MFS transporter n=1 Tax=Arhodomonas aquaeolei TaxID=2369 RepID=UPI000374C148|nr:MFS transporter [Arhodomonas aquaeolei]
MTSTAGDDTPQQKPTRTNAYTGRAHTPKTVVGGTIGNVMEWYDFALYGFFAPVISQLFFPSDNHLASLIATFGVFAAGFVMRPIGGVVFGYVGDRLGRAAVLKISIITMGTATTLLGLLPTHASAGLWAAVLLVGVRLLQGLSVGGEFSGSVTYMVETSPLHRRGFSGSWANFGSLAGTLVGSGLAALVSTLLPQGAVDAWGWRVPFILGGVFALLAYLYVRDLHASPHMTHHQAQHEDDSPLHEALTQNLRETVLAVIFASGYGIVFYIPLVYLPTYASEIGGIGNDVALQVNSLGLALAMPIIPLSGWLTDHVMRRRTLLVGAFVLVALCGWALVVLAARGLPDLIAAQVILALLIALPLGSAPAMLVELFPVADRLTGYSLAYNLGLGVAGGTAPMMASWLMSATGYQGAPGLYLVVAALVAAAALWLMQDRSREPLR